MKISSCQLPCPVLDVKLCSVSLVSFPLSPYSGLVKVVPDIFAVVAYILNAYGRTDGRTRGGQSLAWGEKSICGMIGVRARDPKWRAWHITWDPTTDWRTDASVNERTLPVIPPDHRTSTVSPHYLVIHTTNAPRRHAGATATGIKWSLYTRPTNDPANKQTLLANFTQSTANTLHGGAAT